MNLDKISQIQNVYFIGIGGIGMSALARYFKFMNKNVAGYDKTKTPLTTALEDTGIIIHYEDAVANIPSIFQDKNNTMVVFTPAVPKDHQELNYFRDLGFLVKKRAEVLGIITKDVYTLAIAGTHGKTTTSAILAHILKENNVKLTAFLGGIAENYNSNLILEGNEVVVVEADEFDRSFLQLHPDIAVVTNMDADHLDIYEVPEALHTAFNQFAAKTKDKLLVCNGLMLQGVTYGIEGDAAYSAQNIRVDAGVYVFDVKTPEKTIKDITLNLPGRHNVCNALAAMVVGNWYGLSFEDLAKALLTFKGIQRRFSYQIQTAELVFIDDYAHHPTEIQALHQAVREMYPNKKIVIAFQPHLFSRTKDFGSEFANALHLFDEVLLLPIYPARELPIPGIDSKWLFDKIKNTNKKLVAKPDLIAEIKRAEPEVLLTVGAGDIGLEVRKIKEALL